MTSPLLINAPMLGVASAVETAGAATMAGTGAGAAPTINGIAPINMGQEGLAFQAACLARGAETIGMLTHLVTVRGLFAATITASGAGYTATNAINTTTLSI